MEKRARRAGLCVRRDPGAQGLPARHLRAGIAASVCHVPSAPALLPPSSRNPEPSLQFTSFSDAGKSVFVLFLSSFRESVRSPGFGAGTVSTQCVCISSGRCACEGACQCGTDQGERRRMGHPWRSACLSFPCCRSQSTGTFLSVVTSPERQQTDDMLFIGF